MRIVICGTKGELRWEGHSASDQIRSTILSGRSSDTDRQNDLKSTYCFCAHMHEITKYFLFTEDQEQMSESVLRGFPFEICLSAARICCLSISLRFAFTS